MGKIDNGHYTAFVRHNDNWIRCDDAILTKASFEEVADTEGYVLFYVRERLEFKSQ